jgi:hypothetical protein
MYTIVRDDPLQLDSAEASVPYICFLMTLQIFFSLPNIDILAMTVMMALSFAKSRTLSRDYFNWLLMVLRGTVSLQSST